MAVSMIPYGQLESGNYGINVDHDTGITKASVVEIYEFLPALSDPDNFNGRMVFEKNSEAPYVFKSSIPKWVEMGGVPARVEAVNGNPPVIPIPPSGDLLFDTDTEVLFLFDGVEWFAVGGRYGASIVTSTYVGDGTTSLYPLGTAGAESVEYVEIFWDGVRQYPNPLAGGFPAQWGGGYDIIGGNVIFDNKLPLGVVLLTRTTVAESFAMIPNAIITKTTTVANANQTEFPVGDSGLHQASIFVFQDGILVRESSDPTVLNAYTIRQQDTTILSILKSDPTTAQAKTLQPHSLNVGTQINISGVAEDEFAGDIVVTAVVDPFTFEYAVNITATPPATPDPIIFFNPAQSHDTVIFNDPRAGNEIIEIRTIKNAIISPDGGEANKGINTGAGAGVYGGMSGTNLEFKSIVGGTNIQVETRPDDILITANSGMVEESRVGINVSYHQVSPTESYIGVMDTSSVVTIDLILILNDGAAAGRRVIVKDESGMAGTNNIVINSSGSDFDGVPNQYVINTNYGSVSLVKGTINWFITSKT